MNQPCQERGMSSTMIDRRFFMMAIAALMASGSKDSLMAQEKPLPLVPSDPPRQIADAVWIISDNRIPLVPNVGIVVGAESALVIDCGLGPVNGEKVFDVARRLAPGRNLILTVTHFHPEHGFGAQVFEKDAKIFYNKEQREELAQKGERYIGMFRGLLGSPAAGLLDGTRIVMPHAAYEGRHSEIDLGGRRVEFINWGMAHSRGDQVIFLPQERILFAGDLLEERIFPIFPWFPPDDVDIDAANWMHILNEFEQLKPARIVPGHGSISGLELPRAVHSYMSDLRRQVIDRRSQGRPVDAAIAELRPSILSKYPDWEQPQWIDFTIRYMFEKS
jgi:glyoxylase-like metal-dependent hydrolase (beta-lactamase superfamily II)